MAEEKKTTRARKATPEHSGMFLEIIFKSIQSFVDGAMESVHQSVHMFARRVMRQTMSLFLCLLGFVFIFLGFAKLLNAVYPIPGIGEATIGIFILLLALVLYVFSQEK